MDQRLARFEQVLHSKPKLIESNDGDIRHRLELVGALKQQVQVRTHPPVISSTHFYRCRTISIGNASSSTTLTIVSLNTCNSSPSSKRLSGTNPKTPSPRDDALLSSDADLQLTPFYDGYDHRRFDDYVKELHVGFRHPL